MIDSWDVDPVLGARGRFRTPRQAARQRLRATRWTGTAQEDADRTQMLFAHNRRPSASSSFYFCHHCCDRMVRAFEDKIGGMKASRQSGDLEQEELDLAIRLVGTGSCDRKLD